MPLSRDEILSKSTLATETVSVPEWGGDVIVREMSGSERDAFEDDCLDADRKFTAENIRAKLAARSIVDEQGNRLFTDDDVDALGGKSAAALNRVFTVAQRLSRIGKEDVDELEKNSGRGQCDASS